MALIVNPVLAVFAVPRLGFATGFGECACHDKLKAGLQFARQAAARPRCVGVAANGNWGLTPIALATKIEGRGK